MKHHMFIASILMMLFIASSLADEFKIEPASIEAADKIPGWEVFKWVTDGTVFLETVGENKVLKLTAEENKKGLMLIVSQQVKVVKGQKIAFLFTAKGKGILIGGAYLFDENGERIGGVYGAIKDLKSADEWADYPDTKPIPTEVDGKTVTTIQPYLVVKSGTTAFISKLIYTISTQ